MQKVFRMQMSLSRDDSVSVKAVQLVCLMLQHRKWVKTPVLKQQSLPQMVQVLSAKPGEKIDTILAREACCAFLFIFPLLALNPS